MVFFRCHYKSETDHRLIELVSQGDLRAFEELIERYQRSVLNLAFRFLGDKEEAKDVGQETFLRVYQSVRRYQPIAQFRTYLFRITKNLCLDYLEKKKPFYTADLPEFPSDSNPAGDLQKKELSGILMMAVQSLPENQRIALLLHHFEGLKYIEIAEIMETTVSAIESLLVRAKRTLRDKLKTFY